MSVEVMTTFNNFARGQLDADLNGRYDLPIYNSGAATFENFISNYKGNALFSPGFENLITFQDCAFVEFKYSQNQHYICVMYANKMRFLSYDSNGDFGWVLNPSPTVFEVDTPYTLAESKDIAFRKSTTQNFDSMEFCHEDHPPYELKRIAADEFVFRPSARLDDPFNLTFAATKNITAITQATEAQITVASHGYSVNERVTIESITGMTELNNYTAAVIEVVDTNNFKINVDTSEFTAYTSGGTTKEVLTGDYPNIPHYHKSRLYFGASKSKITTIWASEAGNLDVFTIPSTVTATSALNFTFSELTTDIEWMYSGQNSLILGTKSEIIAVNGGAVGEAITAETIDSILTSADGSSNVQPLSKDGYIFYISNNNKRNLLYFSYDLLSETFRARDANILSYEITQGGIDKMRHVKNREDLVFGIRSDGTLVSHLFSPEDQENILGWHTRSTEGQFKDIAQISNNEGTQQLFALVLRNGSYYIERQAAFVEFSKRRDFYTDSTSRDTDDTNFYRKVAEELKQCIYLDNASVFSDLHTTTITYDSGAGTITDGTGPFVSGDVGKHIVYKTSTGAESGRFLITAYNSATSVDVDVLQTPTANSYSSWYLTFDTLTGLSRFNTYTVSVVTDGGYKADYTVSGGEINVGEQVTHAVVGFGYEGVIKSFTLGFQIQGQNTQTTMKVINEIGVRLHGTAGGRVGSSRYSTDPVQKLGQTDINYLPPLPINTTKYVAFPDGQSRDKAYVVVQDRPLPMHVAAVMIKGSYATE